MPTGSRNISDGHRRYVEALNKHGHHSFSLDTSLTLTRGQRPRCATCGLWEGSSIHSTQRHKKHEKPKRSEPYNSSKERRVALAAALKKFGQHHHKRGIGRICKVCGCSERSRIHDCRNIKPARKTATAHTKTLAVTDPKYTSTFTVNASPALPSFNVARSESGGQEKMITTSCPYCCGNGYISISQHLLKELLNQRA